jgi:hypothetical protein
MFEPPLILTLAHRLAIEITATMMTQKLMIKTLDLRS